jgi:hypothetical protein
VGRGGGGECVEDVYLSTLERKLWYNYTIL